MSEAGERWAAALEPLPGIAPRIPDYVREAGDAMARRLADLEAFVDWCAAGHGAYRPTGAILAYTETWARRLRAERESS